MESIIEQYECAICYKFMEDPCKLPCGHVFCLDCMQILNKNPVKGVLLKKCPYCRMVLPLNYVFKTDL